MRSKAYLMVFDGLADWEPALALCELNKKDYIEVITAGFNRDRVTTMGGIKIVPDITIKEVGADTACIFILPGGDMWEQQTNEELTGLLHRLNAEQVPIAAICGATLAIAKAGLMKDARHTSNSLDYLKEFVPDYGGEGYYINQPAASDKNIITASGVGSVEFAYEIIKQLNLYNEEDTRVWFDLFKHGIFPAAGSQDDSEAN